MANRMALSTEADVSTISGCRFMGGQTADVVIVDDPDATAHNELRVGLLRRLAHGLDLPVAILGAPEVDYVGYTRQNGQSRVAPGRPDWRHWLDTPEETDDTEAHDDAPDLCWRCDAAPGSTDVGLCEECQVDLVAERPTADPSRVVLTRDYLESARYTPTGFPAAVFAERLNAIVPGIWDAVIPAMVSLSVAVADLPPKLLELLTGVSVSDVRRQHAHYARRAGRPRTGKRTRRGR